jgi:twitching motility protein PilT
MRDLEAIEAALTISETGHMVFSTLHTNGALQSITRIIDAFPANQQSQVRTQLSFVLQGIISQQLIPRKNGTGRVMSYELLIPTAAVRNLIREDKVHQIYSTMQISKKEGMCTMNQTIANLVANGVISLEEAYVRCTNIEELMSLLKKVGFNY